MLLTVSPLSSPESLSDSSSVMLSSFDTLPHSKRKISVISQLQQIQSPSSLTDVLLVLLLSPSSLIPDQDDVHVQKEEHAADVEVKVVSFVEGGRYVR